LFRGDDADQVSRTKEKARILSETFIGKTESGNEVVLQSSDLLDGTAALDLFQEKLS